MKFFIILLLFTGLLSLWLSIRLLILRGNLRRMQGILKQTREKGYNDQLRISLGNREMDRLAAEINRNLDYQKELKLSEEAARRELEQSISDIAHDLRTPLTVVKGNLQLLAQEQLSPEGRQYLEVSARKAQSLKEMIDAFFELSVLESDAGEARSEQIDIVSFLASFILEHEAVIREKGLEPEIRFPERSVFVIADPDLLGRVMGNLLTNVCKYASKSFRLEVREDAAVSLSNPVEPGWEGDMDHLFDRTYRADKARRSGSSAGLGLYIAKLLTEKQKGTLEARLEEGELFFLLKLPPKKSFH